MDVPGEQYVLANDLEGASDRTFQAIRRSLAHAQTVKAITSKDWKIVGTKITLKNGSEIKALANDYKGGAGGNQSLAGIDEVWGFTKPSDLGLLTEFAPVPTRENSTVFYTGYQGYEGESNYWHDLIDGVVENGHPVEALAHIEDGDGNPSCWEDGRTFMYFSHMARMPWHTQEYLTERKSRMPLSEYLRVWENRRVKNVNTLCTEEQWDELYDALLRGLHPNNDKRRIVLGADAATKSDCCALVGTTWNSETSKVEQLYSRIWTPQPRVPLNLTETIGPEIVRLHQEYKIEAVYYDPFQMAAIAEMCRKASVNMVEFPQTAQRIKSDTHLRDLIIGKNLVHYGDVELRSHVINAVAKVQGERGIRIFKELSSKKIDGAVALGMSAMGAVEELSRHSRTMTTTENPFFPR